MTNVQNYTHSESIDFLIITPLEAEFNAIQMHISNLAIEPSSEDKWKYYSAIINASSNGNLANYKIIVAPIFGMRGLDALSVAKDAIRRYQPRYVLLVGIAGGNQKNQLHIGDLLISEQLFSYEPQIIGSHGSKLKPRFYEVDGKLLHAAKALDLNTWRSEIAVTRPPKLEQSERRWGLLVSGDKMIRDPSFLENLSNVGQIVLGCDVSGCEMEAAGVAHAVLEAECRPGFLMIRGVSDLAGKSTPDVRSAREYACDVAASFTVALLRSRPVPLATDPTARRLLIKTRQWLDEIRGTFVNGTEVQRTKLEQLLNESLDQYKVVVLLGSSGMGKSALAKSTITRHRAGEDNFFLYADEAVSLEQADSPGPLSTLIEYSATDLSCLILDSVERLGTRELRRRFVALLRAALKSASWRVLLICQASSWQDIYVDLVESGLGNYGRIDMKLFEKPDIELALASLEHIPPNLLRAELLHLLGRPQILDLILRMNEAAKSIDSEEWLSESRIIQAFWEHYVPSNGRDIRHVKVLLELARVQTDNLSFSTPIANLPDLDTAKLLNDLKHDDIVIERFSSYRFGHDLYLDYARQRFLLSHVESGSINELLQRLINPQWHQAIRLLGLHYLDRDNANLENWQRLVNIFQQSPQNSIGTDLFLEAISFTANPSATLRNLSPILLQRKGTLQIFLKRFMLTASVPNKFVIDLLSKDDNPSIAKIGSLEKEYRLPISIPSWLPILDWIVANQDKAIELAPEQCLDLADIWLWLARMRRQFKEETPMATEVDLIIIKLVDSNMKSPLMWNSPYSNSLERLYELFLDCATRHRDKCEKIIERLSGLVSMPDEAAGTHVEQLPELSEPFTELPPAFRESLIPPSPRPSILPRPSPFAPNQNPDQNFQKVALAQLGAERLVELEPLFAKRIFLALLIKPPSRYHSYERYPHDRNYGLQALFGYSPPFNDFPPATNLLAKAPSIALDFIVTLIDFATEQWATDESQWRAPMSMGEHDTYNETAHRQGIKFEAPRIVLNIGTESRTYLGGERVLDWHRGIHGPNVAGNLLMTLENWLYQQPKDASLERLITEKLLLGSGSAATIGLLCDLIRKNFEWLDGSLAILATSWRLYYWDYWRPWTTNVNGIVQMWQYHPNLSPERFKVGITWHQLPHRQVSLREIIALIYARKGFLWEPLDTEKHAWVDLQRTTPNESLKKWLEHLLSLFNKENWEVKTENGVASYEYTPPKQMLPDPKLVSQWEAQNRLNMLPAQCAAILEGSSQLREEELEPLLILADQSPAITDEDIFRAGGVWGRQCAVAAVALLRFPEWLKARPDWTQRCESWVLAACLALSTKEDFAEDPASGMFHWDTFCADALVCLWNKQAEKNDLRLAVATLVGTNFNKGRERLFQNLANIKDKHAEDFSRLLHLGVLFSRLMQIYNSVPRRTTERISFRKAYQRFARDFVTRKLTQLPDRWLPISVSWPLYLSPMTGTKRVDAGFSTAVLWSCFSWIPAQFGNSLMPHDNLEYEIIVNLVQNTTEFASALSEGSRWRQVPSPTDSSNRGNWSPFTLERPQRNWTILIRWWLQSILQLVFRLKPISVRLTHDQTYPTECHEVVIQTAAKFVVSSEAPIDRKMFIIEQFSKLPPKCYYWVTSLISSVYEELTAKSVTSFVSSLRLFFEIAFRSESWWLNNEDVSKSLLGSGVMVDLSQIWTYERKEAADQLRDHLERYCHLAVRGGRILQSFCRVMRCPAMQSVRSEAVKWLANCGQKLSLDNEAIGDDVVVLLEVVVSENNIALAPQDWRQAFSMLLGLLVTKHNRRAILLHQKTRIIEVAIGASER